jgi:Ca2+-binding RTX toxin-like protein
VTQRPEPQGHSARIRLQVTAAGSAPSASPAASALVAPDGSDTLASVEAALLFATDDGVWLDAGLFPGRVTLVGGPGDDTLLGGAGDDSLVGGPGADRLVGRSGDDTLEGGSDADRLDGGPGFDELWGDEGLDTLLNGEDNHP